MENEKRFWLCRHGEKESELGEMNWNLLLVPAGLVSIEHVAASLVEANVRPRRIICSPFPRCVITAGIYARYLGRSSLCIEPALCEVLAPSSGAKGLSEPPTWMDSELLGHLAATGSSSITLDSGYEPVVSQGDLRLASDDSDRSEVNARVAALVRCIEAGMLDNDMLVTHGSPCYRLVRQLTPQKSFEEPPMGSVMELVSAGSSNAENWGCLLRMRFPAPDDGSGKVRILDAMQ
eukprot:gnl/TRDRNA2_/TRDRNA2_150147_c0_seq2.p1 gnl/TRDRNA2_/TRDRNA2_150147_c0~~gnl/TRDRNA2_/TRDRNA2_150147_c0_seq2.p1  ORF type:complete len:235 (+),score=20.74 gnl/TRDRNA2_/TRDRNA2_150147_c0_seq2:16-720(+)